PIEVSRNQIQQERSRERQVRQSQHHPKDRREDNHQKDIEGQHVHVDGFECEYESLVERLCRVGHETGDIELILEIRVAVATREIPDLGDVHHEQDDVRHIDLPGTLDQACAA